jgi:hypothetical protein
MQNSGQLTNRLGGDGPWQGEPDMVEWVDETLLPCLIIRSTFGNFCGYVGITKDHPLFRVGYCDIEQNLDVHGGLTYSDHWDLDAEKPTQYRIWWLGFDCAHAWDLSPASELRKMFFGEIPVYRNLYYVKKECQNLAAQLKAIV